MSGNRAEYHAALERTLYNNVLAGESLDGKAFFYVNPLEADAKYAAYARTMPGMPFKPLLERVEVFDCSCCPPNLVRLFGQIGGVVYGEEDGVLYVDQYISSEVSACGMTLSLMTDLPYSGSVSAGLTGNGRVAFRIPAWQTSIACWVNGAEVTPEQREDYLYFAVDGQTNISIRFGMSVRFVYANSRIRADVGRKAVEYGPFVLCAESADNGVDLSALEIPSLDNATIERTEYGVRVRVPAYRKIPAQALYTYRSPVLKECELILIPYYCWANRGEQDMQIWFL